MRIRLKIDFCEQLLLTLSEFDFARVTHLPFAFSPISPGSISPAAAQTKGRPRLASLRGDHTDRSACYQHRLGCGSCRRRDLPSARRVSISIATRWPGAIISGVTFGQYSPFMDQAYGAMAPARITRC